MFPFVYFSVVFAITVLMILVIIESYRVQKEIKRTIKKQAELFKMLEKEFKNMGT